MALPRVVFDCEILTPTFIAGANQNGPPELGGGSIRGALRYWYRALLGGREASDLSALRDRESAVFGSTDRASPVRLRVLPYDVSDGQRLPSGRIDKLDDQSTGTGYLWYFVQAGDNDRQYIAPGARFEVQLMARPSEEAALEQAAQAFWLLVHLGGLGTRTRRLAGAVAVSHVDAPDNLDLPSFAPKENYDDWLEAQLNALDVGDKPLAGEPPFSMLHPDCADVWLLSGVVEEDWTDLVETVGHSYKNTREDMEVPDKVGLGLPMVTPDGVDPIEVTQNGESVERRASPLWLQVIRRPSGALTPIVMLMRSQFAADGNRVEVSWEGGSETVTEPYREIPPIVKNDVGFDSISIL